jgi:hypothetical protein
MDSSFRLLSLLSFAIVGVCACAKVVGAPDYVVTCG